MAGSSFGKLFQIMTFGESHGDAVGVVIDGCPVGLELGVDDVQRELDRRRPGQSDLTTPRDEKDRVEIFSGVFEGRTMGTPIMMMVRNETQRSKDYSHLKEVFRPGHADFTYAAKYGDRDYRGGGRSSARETLARVAAGAVARKYLKEELGVEIVAYVEQVGEVRTEMDCDEVSREMVERNLVRCPDEEAAERMEELIREVKGEGDSVGGVIRAVVKGMPAGLGEPVFDKLHADLGKAMLSINAVKGFEIGSGFAAAKMRGSEHNDAMEKDGDDVKFKTNNAGGVLGGISTGANLHFRTVFKPVATIFKSQQTVNLEGENVELNAKGRHDPCVLPRAVPIVEAMTALVLMDHHLRNKAV